jgi:predicted Zn-dependent protease
MAPLARLTFLFAASVLLAGCGRVWLPVSIEKRVGEMTARHMLEAMPHVENDPWQLFVDDAGRKLAAASDRPDYDYQFIIVDSPQINAFASPDGEIFITEGLLRLAGRDEEAVASVLGHEIGHVARRHGAESLQSKAGLYIVGVALFGSEGSLARATASLGAKLITLGYGRDMELEADLCSVRYLTRLGYPPRTALKFLRLMAEHEHEQTPVFVQYLQTHPSTSDRIRYAEAYADSLSTPASH